MAAIDKLYVHSYYDYDMLRKWAIAYYPELLFYFYDFDLTYKECETNKKEWLEDEKEIIERNYAKLGDFECLDDAIENLQKHYKETANYDCPKEQATEEVEYIWDRYNKDYDELEEHYTFPVMNTPFKVDKKLLWICPVPCVRKYLEENCGYKTKWYHKLFWKGKKHF